MSCRTNSRAITLLVDSDRTTCSVCTEKYCYTCKHLRIIHPIRHAYVELCGYNSKLLVLYRSYWFFVGVRKRNGNKQR